jgi:hypothetical protein
MTMSHRSLEDKDTMLGGAAPAVLNKIADDAG